MRPPAAVDPTAGRAAPRLAGDGTAARTFGLGGAQDAVAVGAGRRHRRARPSPRPAGRARAWAVGAAALRTSTDPFVAPHLQRQPPRTGGSHRTCGASGGRGLDHRSRPRASVRGSGRRQPRGHGRHPHARVVASGHRTAGDPSRASGHVWALGASRGAAGDHSARAAPQAREVRPVGPPGAHVAPSGPPWSSKKTRTFDAKPPAAHDGAAWRR